MQDDEKKKIKEKEKCRFAQSRRSNVGNISNIDINYARRYLSIPDQMKSINIRDIGQLAIQNGIHYGILREILNF